MLKIKQMNKKFLLSTCITILLTLTNCSKKNSKENYVSIGTGSVTGVYYPTGGAIAKLINQKADAYGIKASVEATAGSVFNINAIMEGDLEFGIVQSDAQYFAVKGLSEWKEKGPQNDLRSICSFHTEAITLVAADDAKISKVSDLKGKTVNLGPPGSGMRTNAIDVLSAFSLNPEKDILAEDLKGSEAPKLLQDGRLDAFFYTVGHPSGVITEASSGKRIVRIVPIIKMNSLLNSSPFYSLTKIPANLYPQMKNANEEIQTIGVKATLVTSAKVSDEVVYAITKEIFDNLDEFKSQHAAFAQLSKENMLEALSAPIHPGALKYYKEVGLKK